MSYLATVKLNGVDVLATHGMYVDDIEGLGPIQNISRVINFQPTEHLPGYRSETLQSRDITLKGTIVGTSNDNLHVKIMAIGELVGWYGQRYRETTLEVAYTSGSALSGDSAKFLVAVKSFDVSFVGKSQVTTAAGFTLRLDVIAALAAGGIVEHSLTYKTGAVTWFYEDENALQGARNFRWELSATVDGTEYPCIMAFPACYDRLTTALGTPNVSGSLPVSNGAFGTHAVTMTTSRIRYNSELNYPFEGTHEITIFARFKGNYAIGDGYIHVLFNDGNNTSGMYLGAYSNGSSDLVFGNGSSLVAVSGITVSSSEWNTVVARQNGSQLDISLKTPSGTYTGVSYSVAALPAPFSFISVGGTTSPTQYAKSVIDEIAIYKHRVSDTVRDILLNADRPLRDLREGDCNRRMVLLLDWSQGATAECNEPAIIEFIGSMASTSTLQIDVDKRQAKLIAEASIAITDASAYIQGSSSGGYLPMWPKLERYNRLVCYGVFSGVPIMRLSYEPLSRL